MSLCNLLVQIKLPYGKWKGISQLSYEVCKVEFHPQVTEKNQLWPFTLFYPCIFLFHFWGVLSWVQQQLNPELYMDFMQTVPKHWDMAYKESEWVPLLALCSGDGGISVDALACWLFQNICNVPRHVPSKGYSEIFKQTRSIPHFSSLPNLVGKVESTFVHLPNQIW